MNYLAIDASTKSSGWAFFKDKQLEAFGCITASSTDKIKRIQKMITELDEVLAQYDIDIVIMEEVRPEEKGQSGNIATHKALMYLQAAIAFLLHEKYPNVKMEFLYPSEWRKICGIKTGAGIKRDSLKALDIAFVKDTFNVEVNDDIADAIGIGFAYTINKAQPQMLNFGL